MKRMVCEICESTSIKKIDGTFVCSQCGAEYSVEEAKKLLIEVDELSSNEQTEVASNSGNKPIKIESEKKTIQDEEENLELLKLKYDLFCWYSFHKKCRDLQETFYIEDVYNSDTRDITQRPLNYDYEKAFNKLVFERFEEHYLMVNDVDKKFKEKVREQEMANERRIKAVEKNNGNFWGRVFLILAVIFTIVITFTAIMGFGGFILGAIIAGAFVFILDLILKANDKRVNSMPYYETLITYPEYIENEVRTSAHYKNQLSIAMSNFENIAKKDAKIIVQNLPELIEIRKQMLLDLQIPENYTTERAIKSLLALVLDKRADTLKEAINLYETENYRASVINSLDRLNNNICALFDSINALRGEVQNLHRTVVEGFSIVIKQNNEICNQLESINYNTAYLVVDRIFN